MLEILVFIVLELDFLILNCFFRFTLSRFVLLQLKIRGPRPRSLKERFKALLPFRYVIGVYLSCSAWMLLLLLIPPFSYFHHLLPTLLCLHLFSDRSHL